MAVVICLIYLTELAGPSKRPKRRPNKNPAVDVQAWRGPIFTTSGDLRSHSVFSELV
jgi:hypothetical protein